jgi:uncharacterized glyoxalase superfamily protein PhnB
MAHTQVKALRGTGLMPSLTVDNVQRSLEFFTGLGFEVEERWEEGGALTGVSMKAGNVQLGLTQDDGKKGRDRIKGVGMRLYVEVANNIDDAAADAKAAGITLTREPHDIEFGSRAFDVTEPSGFVLTIMSPMSK